MGNALRYLILMLLFIVFAALSASVPVMASNSQEEIFVGRISHVEGKLLRYIEEEKDWVLTVRDSPFGLEDALYSGVDAKAEFIMPNRTWIRVGENTQIQLIDLNPDATTVDVASGLARFYNNSDDAVIKTTTPFGYVVATADAIFDIYVGDESIEVIAIRGSVDFVHNGSKLRYEVVEGSSSIIADDNEVVGGNGTVDSKWDDWNSERDELWVRRLQRSTYSAEFLPEPIRDEAYALEENGQWERVYYEGTYVEMWRPIRVAREWRPFTAGRWTVYYGDNCWIPDESFGYVTHHYGSWVYIDSSRAWYWMPPVAYSTPDIPEYFIGFGWYPGRVGWIHSGPSIGWVPLAPNEPYYGYRSWGQRTVVVDHTTVVSITDIRYRYVEEAVIIDRDRFYSGTRYTPYLQRDVSRDVIVNNYQPVTVINNTVINNYNSDRRRFAYNDVEVSRKPHATVMNRISDNQRLSRKSGRIDRERIERDLTRLDVRSELPQEREARRPALTTKLVDADQIRRPISALSLPKKEIKPKERERRISVDKGQRGLPRDAVRPRDTVDREEQRRIRSPRDPRSEESDQVIRQPGQGRQFEEKDRERSQEEQRKGERQKVQEPAQLDAGPGIRSPREKGNQEIEQRTRRQDQIRQQEEIQLEKEQQMQRRQQVDEQRQQEQGLQRRQEREVQDRQEQQRRSAIKVEERQQEERQKIERQKTQGPVQRDAEPGIRSPREQGYQQAEPPTRRQDQIRQQEEIQLQKEQQMQRRQQEKSQRLQEQETQQRQQVENQRRQEQEVQRRQQQDERRRLQEQETQQRQQVENQRRQEQEVQRRQQEERQSLQEQKAQQRQQVENQRRQQQEVQRQQQGVEQVRPKQERQRQLQEEVQGPQQQPQSVQKKKRTPQEQEEWEKQQQEILEQQQKSREQGEQRSRRY